jgi:hypothetical protein
MAKVMPRQPHPYAPADEEADEHRVRLRRHPRARTQIAYAKGWGALGGFALTFIISLHAGVPMVETALRALAGGIVGLVLAWAVVVSVWRQLAIAEVERAKRALAEAAEGES